MTLLLLHIIIAIVGLGSAVVTSLKPSRTLINVSMVTITTTVSTGALLVLQGSSLLHVCLVGIVYTVIAGSLTFAGSVRLRQVSAVKASR